MSEEECSLTIKTKDATCLVKSLQFAKRIRDAYSNDKRRDFSRHVESICEDYIEVLDDVDSVLSDIDVQLVECEDAHIVCVWSNHYQEFINIAEEDLDYYDEDSEYEWYNNYN